MLAALSLAQLVGVGLALLIGGASVPLLILAAIPKDESEEELGAGCAGMAFPLLVVAVCVLILVF